MAAAVLRSVTRYLAMVVAFQYPGDLEDIHYESALLAQPASTNSTVSSFVPSSWPTSQPSLSSGSPSSEPSSFPTASPIAPTSQPSGQPTKQPTSQPTVSPTSQPSRQPSRQPTKRPVSSPTSQPSRQPTKQPVSSPTSQPSNQPTSQPTQPTGQPTSQPTTAPSGQPTANPTQPSSQPTSQPSRQPTEQPTASPTSQPSSQPSKQPTRQPSSQPTSSPSTQPSAQPTNPTGQPTSHPTNPTGQPTGQPSGEPTSHPTPVPTTETNIIYNWVFDPKYGLDLSVDVSLSINGACILYCMWTMYSNGIDASASSRKSAGLLAAALITLLNFIFLCARFDYFLNSGSSYDLKKTQEGEYVWVGESYDSANVPTLRNANCEYTIEADGSVAELFDTPEDLCNFMVLGFSGDLIGDGMTKFSIGLGLMFFFIFMWIAFGAKMLISDAVNEYHTLPEDATRMQRITNGAVKFLTSSTAQYLLIPFIQSQQFCVLMLLTNVTANDYCAQFIVPTSQRNAICLYQYGVHALPWGLIMLICTVVGVLLAEGFAAMGGYAYIGALICAGLAAFCGVHAVGLLAFWLFAGFGVGLWFQFASLAVTARYVAVELLSISALVISDVLGCIATALAGCNLTCVRRATDCFTLGGDLAQEKASEMTSTKTSSSSNPSSPLPNSRNSAKSASSKSSSNPSSPVSVSEPAPFSQI
jgi:hypothetical protein